MGLFTDKGEWYEQGRPRHDPEVETFLSARFDRKASVLELGAGTGSGTRILSRIFSKIIAVEPERQMFNRLQQSIDPGKVECRNSTVQDLSPTEISFDYLIAFQATHWFYRTAQYRALYHRAAKPVLDISTHDRAANLDERDIVDSCNVLFRRPDFFPDCCDVPSNRLKTWERQERVPIVKLASAICSRSWIDHERFCDILNHLTSKLKGDAIDMTIVTVADEILIKDGQQPHSADADEPRR